MYLVLISIGLYTVYLNSPFGVVAPNSIITANIFQRIFGLTVFIMFSVQLMVGALMPRLTEKFGGWVYSLHIYNGAIVYLFTLLHILAFGMLSYFAGRGFDPFYLFSDFCILCTNSAEHYVNLGRFAFLFLTAAVGAAAFRTVSNFLRTHWRKFHILNYLIFALMSVHTYLLGTDVLTAPFVYLYWGFNAGFTALLLKKVKAYFR